MTEVGGETVVDGLRYSVPELGEQPFQMGDMSRRIGHLARYGKMRHALGGVQRFKHSRMQFRCDSASKGVFSKNRWHGLAVLVCRRQYSDPTRDLIFVDGDARRKWIVTIGASENVFNFVKIEENATKIDFYNFGRAGIVANNWRIHRGRK